MDRVLQNTPVTASVTYYEDGAIVDPGTVTVGITREDGTVLIAAGTATTGTGAAARTYDLTAANLSLLDILKLTWTSATKGERTTYMEVVGGFLFTVSEARALSPLSDTTKYPTADIIAARTAAEMALEDICRVAFVPRYNREGIDGDGTTDLLLEKPRPIEVLSASIGGTAIDASAITLYRDGRAYYEQGWTKGRGKNVVIKYTHGYPYPPPRVGIAALKLAKWVLVDSPLSDRAIRNVTPEGEQWLVVSGVRGAVTSIPECNIVCDLYGYDIGLG